MAEVLLGVDVGTTGVKTVAVDRSGQVLAQATAEHPLHTPRPLWAEQNPEDWWRGVRQTIAQASAGYTVSGIGLSGQMHGSVFLDAGGQLIRPAILWCDQRTQAECEEIERRVPRLAQITCNPALTGFTAPKILWLRNNEPDSYARVAKVLLPKDYVRYRLTGEFATEVSDASGTSLFDVPARRWSDEVLDGLDIPRQWLPACHESPEVTGRTEDGAPVVGGGGDQAAGAVGVGIVRPGLLSTSIGTSGVVFTALDEPSVDPGLSAHTFCHAVPGKWHAMGVMLSAAGSLRWYRDTFQPGAGYEQLTAEAATVPAGCEGLLFLPYLSGERTPHKDPNAKGVFFGATLVHGRAHFTRAVLEGVAFGLRDSYELLCAMGMRLSEARVLGGGARSDLWLQILSDATGCSHTRVQVEEGPAYGAALLAGVGVGWWASVEEACDATIRTTGTIHPERPGIYDGAYHRFRALYLALAPLFWS